MRRTITVLFKPRSITFHYTLAPLWTSSHRREFLFTHDLRHVMERDTNPALLLVGWFKGREADPQVPELLQRLRDKYHVMAYFDDNDGTESHCLHWFPFFDLCYKKQIFRDRQLYLRQHQFYGSRVFSDYYHHRFGVVDPVVVPPAPPPLPRLDDSRQLDKLRLAWNLAFGQYPTQSFRKVLARSLYRVIGDWGPALVQGVFPTREPLDRHLPQCHARFSPAAYPPSIGYQRHLLLERIAGDTRFLSGPAPRAQYQREMRNSRLTLSPFGWGEVCYRDFEAIRCGSTLLKPDMAHVETWPDVYENGVTYAAVDWDANNLHAVVDRLLGNPQLSRELAHQAWCRLQVAHAAIEARVEELLAMIRGLL